MRFVKLYCKNFGTFKSLEYDFEDKAILIQGENLSDDSQESNGSGKSFIQAAIEFALFKTTSRKVNDVELINYDEDEAIVSLSIECPIRKEVFSISRTIRRRGSSILSLTINDSPVTFANVNDGNKLIIEWIGISSDDLQNYYIINKERFRSIFSSSNREKVELIGRFNRSSLINGVDKLVQQDIIDEEHILSEILKKQTSLQSKIDTLETQLDFELNRDFEEEKRAEIFSKLQKIDKLQASINDSNNLIKEIQTFKINDLKQQQDDILHKVNEIEQSISSVNEWDDSELTEIQSNRKTISETISKKLEERSKVALSLGEIQTTISEIEKIIKGSVDCPKCGHKFNIGNPDIDIEEEKKSLVDAISLSDKINEKIKSITQTVNDFELQVSSLNKDIKIIEAERDDFNRSKKVLNETLEGLSKQFSSIDNQMKTNNDLIDRLKFQISSSENDIKNLMSDIESIKSREQDRSRIDFLKSEIKKHSKDLKSLDVEMNNQKSKILEVSQWIMNFKKFNVHLANLSLLAIQANCNKFLKDIKSDIQIRWEGFKILANGSTKEEITSYIIRDNVVRDFWSFSGGERARMEYAMIFTLQKMINSTNKYGGLSFLSTDEIAEGLDSQGLHELMKSFESLNKTILITTHVVNRSISNNVLLIRKENNESRIIKN